MKNALVADSGAENGADISDAEKELIRESLKRYQKTSEVVTGTAETVANKWADMRNSSLFKSFESKLGSAYSNAKMAASTSIDHLAGASRPSQNNSQAGTPRSEQPPAPLS
ncbi:tumor protein d52 family domain-containing protein [Ditylenchus destructor]|nr:tumor protein d52 family domain-containing protein [Ditylenchus destructor]